MVLSLAPFEANYDGLVHAIDDGLATKVEGRGIAEGSTYSDCNIGRGLTGIDY